MAKKRSPQETAVTAIAAALTALGGLAVLLWNLTRRRHPSTNSPVIGGQGASHGEGPRQADADRSAAAGQASAPLSQSSLSARSGERVAKSGEEFSSFPGREMAATLEGKDENDLVEPPDDPALRSRRRVLAGLSIAIAGAGATLVAVPVIGTMLDPLFRKTENQWRAVGPPANFAIGTTTAVTFDDPASLVWAGVSARTAAWLRRDSTDQFIAFKVNCTHRGCPVRWLATANLFMCPCHGGVFYGDGAVAAGPPQKPLETYAVRVQDGQVQVLTGAIPIT